MGLPDGVATILYRMPTAIVQCFARVGQCLGHALHEFGERLAASGAVGAITA